MDLEFSLRNDILNFSRDPLKGSSWTFLSNTVLSRQEMKLNLAVVLICESLESRGCGLLGPGHLAQLFAQLLWEAATDPTIPQGERMSLTFMGQREWTNSVINLNRGDRSTPPQELWADLNQLKPCLQA